ncbi:MAG: glycosyltransferase [Bacteroidetes bacterium]|nr:glycosyltransferase [Bacteroidota bacterium]
MSRQAPLVTVLIPVFNAEETLAASLSSILNQTYRNLEILLINDGSTDGSDALIHTFTDKRIRYIVNPDNIKLPATLNKGLNLAKGKYICRMDADDLSFPERIEKQVRFMEENPNIGVSGTWMQMRVSGRTVRFPITHDEIRTAMIVRCPLAHPSVILRKRVLEESGLTYNTEFPSAQDFDLWQRLSLITQLANIPEVLLEYNNHTGQISNKLKDQQNQFSDKIRLRAIQPVSAALNDSEKRVYLNFLNKKSPESITDFQDTAQVLKKLFELNQATGAFPVSQFNRQYGRLWFTLMDGVDGLSFRHLRLFLSHPLGKSPNVHRSEQIKLIFKVIKLRR